MSILLLDVDGTLIDSFPGIRAGFLHTLDMLGHEHPPEEFIARIPGGWADATAFPGMLDLVRRWKGQGHTVATATSKGESFAEKILAREGFLDHIDFLGAAQEDGPRRSKSAVIAHVLASTGWETATSDILMVGDRSHDIEGAAEHGIDTVAVTWGYGTPEEWATARATAHSPEELEGIVHDCFTRGRLARG